MAARSLLLLASCTLVAAEFNFRGCSYGYGNFTAVLVFNEQTNLGVIPAEKTGVKVWMESVNNLDLDVQLYDLDDTSVYPEGQKIVGWTAGNPNEGILQASSREVKTYQGMTFNYSGFSPYIYNSALSKYENRPGNEDIAITGATTRDLQMKLYGYAAGTATVHYSWTGDTSTCCAGTTLCYGFFEQELAQYESVDVGEIEAGIESLTINLTSTNDVDVQLYDLEDTSTFAEGKRIIGYTFSADNPPVAGLGESYAATRSYKSLDYYYSGFLGFEAGKPGNEQIKVLGTTNTKVMMKAWGYAAGTAKVSYSYSKTPLCSNMVTDQTKCEDTNYCTWADNTCSDYDMTTLCAGVLDSMQSECTACAREADQAQCVETLLTTYRSDKCTAFQSAFSSETALYNTCIACGGTTTVDIATVTTCVQDVLMTPIATCIHDDTAVTSCLAGICNAAAKREVIGFASATCVKDMAYLHTAEACPKGSDSLADVARCLTGVTLGGQMPSQAYDAGGDSAFLPSVIDGCEYDCACENDANCCTQSTWDGTCTNYANTNCCTEAPTPQRSMVGTAEVCKYMPTPFVRLCIDCAYANSGDYPAVQECIEVALLENQCELVSHATTASCMVACENDMFRATVDCVNLKRATEIMDCLDLSEMPMKHCLGRKCNSRSIVADTCPDFIDLSYKLLTATCSSSNTTNTSGCIADAYEPPIGPDDIVNVTELEENNQRRLLSAASSSWWFF